MKHFLTSFIMILFLANAIGQNVGINNTDPQTALDIHGKLRIRPSGFEVTSTSITLQSIGEGYFSLNGSPSADFSVTLPSGVKGTFLLIENTTSFVATVGTLAQIPSGKSKLFLFGDTGWILAHDSAPSQLERITEGYNPGWRLLGRDPNNYGDIGDGAVDLSYADNPSSTIGATGWYSLATGIYTTASGSYSTAMGDGSYATGETSLAANSSWAAGLRSGAFNEAQAHGENSFATGNGYVGDTGTNAAGISGGGAFGVNSAALGVGTHAVAFSSTAVGRYNEGEFNTANRTTWVDTDPLFMIGNGTADGDRRNAFLVRKNGNTSVSGTLDALADATMHTNLLIKDNLTVQDDALVEGSSTTQGKASVHGQLTVGYNGVGKSTIETDKSFGAGFLTISSDLTLNEDHHTIRVGQGLTTNPTITLPSPGSSKFRM